MASATTLRSDGLKQLMSISQVVRRSTHGVVFFGSDSFALAHLNALQLDQEIRRAYHIRFVVTAASDTPVARHCVQTGLPWMKWPKSEHPKSIAERLLAILVAEPMGAAGVRRHPPADCLLGIVVSFGRFLPDCLIDGLKMGVINVHPSLLPRWRGASPLFHTILAGDRFSGVSVLRILAQEPADQRRARVFDAGPLLLQRPVALPARLRFASISQLEDFLLPHCLEALRQVLMDLPARLAATTVQSPYDCQRAPLLTAEMGNIDWHQQSSEEIVRLWHALHPRFILTTSFELAQIKDSNQQSANPPQSSVVPVRLKEPPILVSPITDSLPASSDPYLAYIEVAQSLLNPLLDLKNVSPGSIVYIRKLLPPQMTLRQPMGSQLPLAFVLCRDNSWLALSSVVIGRRAVERRPLAGLDFYSGYIVPSPQFRLSFCLAPGLRKVGNFRSLKNPLWPLPPPLTKAETDRRE